MHPVCKSEGRLDLQSFLVGYGGMRAAHRAFADAARLLPLDALLIEGGGERCAFNRYLFLDFTLAFGLLDDIAPGVSHADAARARDALFDQVAAHVVEGTDEGFGEWSTHDLTNDNLDRFLSRGSERHSTIERWIAPLQAPPLGKVDDAFSVAVLLAHRARESRTPFSSVFTRTALVRATERLMQRTLACVVERVESESCDVTLFEIARSCTHADDARAIEVLGGYASQHIDVFRDLAAFVRQSAGDDEGARRRAERVLQALADGARAHHRIETRGLRCGAAKLYPTGTLVDDAPPSGKPHHFYAVAHLAHTLLRMGIDGAHAERAALVVATRDNAVLRLPTVAANLLLGRPLFDGAATDQSRTRAEQERGARFGAALHENARASGADDSLVRTRTVRFSRSLDRSLVDVRFDPHRSSALLVTVREQSPRPAFGIAFTASREIVWRVDLGPGEKDALLARGIPLPGVSLDDDAVRVRY